jgi:3-dehydrosphinganine reductase
VKFQHAIITGGSSGIGKAVAALLAREGTSITLVARRPDLLATARGEIDACRPNGMGRTHTYPADVADQKQIDVAIRAAIAELGPPDLLVTSAGIVVPGHFRTMPIEAFERTMAVNYFGTLYAIRAVLPAMEKEKRGHLLLMSSGAGLIGIHGYTSYSPTKFAVRGLAEALRSEAKIHGIGVSIVYPPDTDTPQLEEENRTKPPETKRITGTAAIWSATDVARVMLRGARRNQFAINPGAPMWFLDHFHSILRPILHRFVDKVVREEQTRRQ